MKEYTCDVLIVGGGGAALRAAIETAEREPSAHVILVTKGCLGKSGVTANACSDRMAFHTTLPFTEPGGKDNWKYHADDIYRIGGCVSDEDLAQVLARNAREAFEYLDRLGVPWVKEDGRPHQFLTDGSRFARACYTGPYTANHIEKALVEKVKVTPVKILENFMVADLIASPSQDRVIGAFGLRREEEEVLIRAKTVILAAGGAGEAFKINVYTEGMTGDGYAMAYRVGAELVNMEFIQVGLSSVKTKLACSGSMMRAIPRFINDREEEFLATRYLSSGIALSDTCRTVFQKGSSWPVSFEHSSRMLDIAVYKELRKGRKVYLDYNSNARDLEWDKLSEAVAWYRKIKRVDLLKERELKESPLSRLERINPEAVWWRKERGIDLEAGDRIEIAPAAQHFQGGVKIREGAQASIKGLYAAGECAGAQHGANRPGGNALLDSQVFGKIAGLNALNEAKMTSHSSSRPIYTDKIRDNLRILQTRSGREASLVRSKIQDLLFQCATIMRTEEGLGEGLKKLAKIEEQGIRVDKRGLVFALETRNLLTVAKMIMGAARIRRESRGPHLYFHSLNDSEPLPRNDKLWQKYIVVKKTAKNMQFEIEKPVTI